MKSFFYYCISILAATTDAAPVISLSDAKGLTNAAMTAAESLVKYYVPNFSGSVQTSDASDSSGVQWYESGIMWETLMRTTQATGNDKLVSLVTGALVNASYGPEGSFFGPAATKNSLYSLFNQWNDDIGWWGMAAITGAELYSPKTVMPGGATYYDLGKNTADDIWFSWDASTCGGGIYWTRDRNAKTSTANVNAKTIITNVQYMSYAARLYMLQKDQTIWDHGVAVYAWLKAIGLIDTSHGQIWDGVTAPSCTDARSEPADSYIYGQLIEALALMYKATNQISYLTDAETFANTAMSTFTQNNVIRDNCEPKCPPNRVSPKGIFIRGLYTLHAVATPATKAKIATLINTSFSAMLNTCDSAFNCDNNWGPEGVVRSDFHSQLNSVELFNAAVFLNAPSSRKLTEPSQSAPPTKSDALITSSLLAYPIALLGTWILSAFA